MAEQTARNWSSGDIVTAANLSSIERGVSAMAEEYTPTTWANGNTVTAAALNNIEQGIANAGGGSSDFSTATVTFICNSPEGDELRCTVARAIEADPPFVPTARSWGNLSLAGGEEMVVTVILYKGRCVCTFENATSASGTGAIEDIGSTGAIITGDCTITISDSSSNIPD